MLRTTDVLGYGDRITSDIVAAFCVDCHENVFSAKVVIDRPGQRRGIVNHGGYD